MMNDRESTKSIEEFDFYRYSPSKYSSPFDKDTLFEKFKFTFNVVFINFA